MNRIGDIVEFCLSVYLLCLFKYPANIYLQKFDIVVWVWCIVICCITIIGFCGFILSLDVREKLKQETKKKQLLGHITTIILLILLILNDFSFCFVVYMISYLIGFYIRAFFKEQENGHNISK